MEPKITVVVPTRDRCDTLQYTLKTCTSQNYDNLTILVSDNYSQDQTKDVVSAFPDPRLVYVNTGKRLSMSDNWEFGLSRVNGGYVLFLGDDDGLLPEAIRDLANLIEATQSEAICWEQAFYLWPSQTSVGESNILNISMKNDVVRYQSKDILSQVAEFKIDYKKLPGIYWGLASYALMDKIKKKSDRFFHSMIPDIYSSLAIGSQIEEYWFSERPYSVAGLSKHSIGTTYMSEGDKKSAPVSLYLSEDNIPFHKELVMAPSVAIALAECILQVKDNLGKDNLPELDYEKLLLEMMQEAVTASPEKYRNITLAVLEIADHKNLTNYGKKIVKLYKNAPFVKQYFIKGYNIINKLLTIDCEPFGITNIYEASLLCHYILMMKKDYLPIKKAIKKTFISGFNKIKKETIMRYYSLLK
jgi:glycosyltransferase involved in cell wall biosynthesis